MSNFVLIKDGVYRGIEVKNTVFPLLKPLKEGAKGMFVTVNGTDFFGSDKIVVRVKVASVDSIEYINSEGEAIEFTEEVAGAPVSTETPEEAKARIRRRFEILDQMVTAMTNDVIRGLILSGPPGVGKSYGVEQVLEAYEIENRLSKNKPFSMYEVVKGTTSAIGLYKTLYNNSERGQIVVFDDCDSILWDEQCLNMLKAVLDSGKKRTVSWRTESRVLADEGIPNKFDFRGGVVFITNLSFENVRSKKISDHLQALMSRCHYIDLGMDNINDCFLRIEQIVEDGMLDEYGFSEADNVELIQFMRDNSARLREVSLRMVQKIADLKKMSEADWMELATTTCMKRAGG